LGFVRRYASAEILSMTIRIGISGWRYAPWRGVFYPSGLAQHRELEYAARAFPSIELNGSFYSLQAPQSWLDWYRETPANFIFAVKGNRYITHFMKLKNVEKPLANFFASGLFNLREKLGPILWQFPPQLGFDPTKFARFLDLLPRDTAAALALARGRESRMHGRSRLAIDRNRRLRHAVEIRHDSFLDPAFTTLLRRYNVALVVADTAGKWPYREDVTADFVYLRLHGDKKIYSSGYSPQALARWAQRIGAWHRGGEPRDAHRIGGRGRPARRRDVYCYFDNDAKVHAPFNARSLEQRLLKR
jgi:uncharacterized protein YecE (DUF72 family)